MDTKISINENDITKRFIRSFEELRYRGFLQTKSEFCARTDVRRSDALNRIECGEQKLSLSNIVNLINNFGVSSDWLFYGTEKFLVSENEIK